MDSLRGISSEEAGISWLDKTWNKFQLGQKRMEWWKTPLLNASWPMCNRSSYNKICTLHHSRGMGVNYQGGEPIHDLVVESEFLLIFDQHWIESFEPDSRLLTRWVTDCVTHGVCEKFCMTFLFFRHWWRSWHSGSSHRGVTIPNEQSHRFCYPLGERLDSVLGWPAKWNRRRYNRI